MASEEKKESQTFEKRTTNSCSPLLEGEASNQSEKGFDRNLSENKETTIICPVFPFVLKPSFPLFCLHSKHAARVLLFCWGEQLQILARSRQKYQSFTVSLFHCFFSSPAQSFSISWMTQSLFSLHALELYFVPLPIIVHEPTIVPPFLHVPSFFTTD